MQPTNTFTSSLPPLEHARVSSENVRAVLAYARECGADIARIGRDHGVENLHAEFAEDLPVATHIALLQAFSEAVDDPAFGLHVSERARIGDIPVYGYILCSCPNFQEVIAQTIRYESLAHDLGRSEFFTDGPVATYRWHSPWLHIKGSHHVCALVAALIRTLSSYLARTTVPVFAFSFPFPEPDPKTLAEYKRVLGADVKFNSDVAMGTFPTFILTLPLPNADMSLLPALQHIAEVRLASLQRGKEKLSVIQSVSEEIRKKLTYGRPELEDIASAMNIGTRTLQRKLVQAGTTFSNVLSETRRELAATYLRDAALSLTEVAMLLGYSEQSNFNHAFDGWYGMSPSQWRKKNSSGRG